MPHPNSTAPHEPVSVPGVEGGVVQRAAGICSSFSI